jgi:hypothetical protein
VFDGLDPVVQPFFVGVDAWPTFAERVQPHLQKMADGSGGRYLREDIQAAITSGVIQLWLALDGAEIVCAMTTQVMDYPRLRALRCIGVVGHRPRRWMHLMHHVERAAKKHFGCDRMEAMHQPRHGLLLQTPGWQTFHVLSEKHL